MSTKKKRTTKRGRPFKDDTAPDTQETILDAAEDHFAKRGFHGVTMRQVAAQAGVDIALLNYYFGSKRGLFEAVFRRRAEIVNIERIARLDAYAQRMGAKVTVEDAVEAFVSPLFEWGAKGGQKWRHYFALLAQVNNTPEWGGETMARFFDPVVQRLIEVLRVALPGAREEDLFWSYHLLSGALTLTLSQTGRIDRLSAGICHSEDFESVHARMIPFIAAGFRAVCRPTSVPPAAVRSSKGAQRGRTTARRGR